MLWNSPNEETPPEDPKPIPRENLPPQLQQLVDHDDRTFYDDIYGPYSIDSTDTPYRYAGYANRLRTILLSAHRYVAYTSDIGESFRPVSHPYLVRSAYAISWTYLLGDVAHEGYKAYLRNRDVLAPPCESYKDAASHGDVVLGMATGNVAGSLRPQSSGATPPQESLTPWPATSIPLIEDYRVVMAKRAVFQGLASMGLPALTIHSVVKHSGRMLKGYKSALLRTWTPIGVCIYFHLSLPSAPPWSLQKESILMMMIARPRNRPLPPLHLRRARRPRRAMGLPGGYPRVRGRRRRARAPPRAAYA
ncbi:mitochondrial 18 KDa protein-domain-containing protein [Aspergillus taichungensis]|uniref:Mitochondrial fission process protein 1 n=1 Tax=Aspergillus taichungensis TaxID=482145 RepID=A0A2J5HIS6_9EURO|nr:mitochondrial 18 KDa protein-domain-containing protein [Aspergillus taichungensis]